jgi:SAM-dependent methyltransferase
LSTSEQPNDRIDAEGWTEHYEDGNEEAPTPRWPAENLIRMVMGSYIPGMDRQHAGRDVLDVGCGNGNNLVFLGSTGMNLYGTEIDERICAGTTKDLADRGYKSEIVVGTNQDLPYPDDRFDYLVSWNVIHYEQNDADVIAGLREYARVLKPGGRLFMSTTGPKHFIIRNAESIGSHLFSVSRSDDFRFGQPHYCFETSEYLEEACSAAFDDVRVGRTTDELFTDTIDWFVATAVKPSP